MWSDDVIASFKVACDTVLPGISEDGAHLRVIELFDRFIPGFPVLVSGILDTLAQDVEAGSAFVALNDEQRGEIFRKMITDPAPDIQDIVNGIFVLTLGQAYSEANPRHDEVWSAIGYKGPSLGVPEFRRQSA